ncbi:MAG: hypothetical protein M3O74_11565 [Pseudomonadota bacterium]|nr:hypothetical protein [Pseudomonadota bacterium]
MSTSALAKQAKSLARNPLGIIALFIVMIYGLAASALGLIGTLTLNERMPMIWFLVLFPVLVLLAFIWLVSKHHEKLYAPTDYESDEGFFRSAHLRIQRFEAAKDQQSVLKANVINTLIESTDIDKDLLPGLINQISADIDSSTAITIDLTTFMRDPNAILEYPITTFINFSDLLNEIYFKIEPRVKPYQYGDSWILRDKKTNTIVKNSRMIQGSTWGRTEPDTRSLREVGINSGTALIVENINPVK